MPLDSSAVETDRRRHTGPEDGGSQLNKRLTEGGETLVRLPQLAKANGNMRHGRDADNRDQARQNRADHAELDLCEDENRLRPEQGRMDDQQRKDHPAQTAKQQQNREDEHPRSRPAEQRPVLPHIDEHIVDLHRFAGHIRRRVAGVGQFADGGQRLFRGTGDSSSGCNLSMTAVVSLSSPMRIRREKSSRAVRVLGSLRNRRTARFASGGCSVRPRSCVLSFLTPGMAASSFAKA